MPNTATCTNSVTVRIVKDTKSRDGWIARTLKGKICFIDNLASFISTLEPGQLYNATINRDKGRFMAIDLQFPIR